MKSHEEEARISGDQKNRLNISMQKNGAWDGEGRNGCEELHMEMGWDWCELGAMIADQRIKSRMSKQLKRLEKKRIMGAIKRKRDETILRDRVKRLDQTNYSQLKTCQPIVETMTQGGRRLKDETDSSNARQHDISTKRWSIGYLGPLRRLTGIPHSSFIEMGLELRYLHTI